MRKLIIVKYIFILFLCITAACSTPVDNVKVTQKATTNFHYAEPIYDTLESGSTYLSVYSHIYSNDESKIHNLTATVSIRNTSTNDTLFVSNAAYYNTHGDLIKNYFDKTVFLKPLETIEIVISEADMTGGSGANFVFDWHIKPHTPLPLFEAVMISTKGQQGLSFLTQGKRIQ